MVGDRIVSKRLRAGRTGRIDWETPVGVFSWACRTWGRFTLDAAATAENALCPRFITEAEDALRVDWAERAPARGPVWINPPFGRGIDAWVAKAAETGERVRTVALLPAHTDRRWWNVVHHRAADVVLITGRVSFTLAGKRYDPPTFGVALACFDPVEAGPADYSLIHRDELQGENPWQ